MKKKDQKDKLVEDEENPEAAPFRELFRYVTRQDKFLIVFGCFMALVSGSSYPLMAGFLGNVTNVFDPSKTPEQILTEASSYALGFLILGAIIFVFIMAGNSTLITVGTRQNARYRQAYFSALLQQEPAWYDQISATEISTQVAI